MQRPLFYILFNSMIAAFYMFGSMFFIGYGFSLWENENSILDVICFVIAASLWTLFVASTRSILDEDY